MHRRGRAPFWIVVAALAIHCAISSCDHDEIEHLHAAWLVVDGQRPFVDFLEQHPPTLIASSSGIEAAHESEQIQGSFFTHHFVAGMRGAGATPRGDGVVTITDAFTYARDRTVRDSAVVAEQPQHPSFSMNLRGRADLPLARVDSSPTALELRETEGPLQLIDLASGLVVLEVPSGKRTLRLAVPLGRYLLRRQGERGTYAREMQVEPGATAVVTEEDLFMAPSMAGTDKGFDSTPPRASFLAPRRYDGLTAYGGPLFAFLAGHNEWRLGTGLETHITDNAHLFFEPDFGLNERSRTALRLGILFR